MIFKRWCVLIAIFFTLASPASSGVVEITHYFGEWSDAYVTVFDLRDERRYSQPWGHSALPGTLPNELLFRLGDDIAAVDRFLHLKKDYINYFSFIVVGDKVIYFVSVDPMTPAVPEIPTALMMLSGIVLLIWRKKMLDRKF